MTAPLESDVIAVFGPESNNPDCVQTLIHLARIHAITLDDLHIKWEQFCLQKPTADIPLNNKSLDSFKQYLQAQMEKKVAISMSKNNQSANSSIKKPKNVTGFDGSGLFGYAVPNTPTMKRRKLHATAISSPPSEPLELNRLDNLDSALSLPREAINLASSPLSSANSSILMTTPNALRGNSESGKVLESLNPENISIAEGLDLDSNGSTGVNISLPYDLKKYKFRTMRQNLIDASDVLDEQIEMFTNLIKKHYGIDSSEFSDPTSQSQSELYAVGRIVPDSPTSDQRLNIESLALETSRMAGIGRRVRLDLKNVDEASLFPGQIIALRGKNADGENFVVSQIIYPPFPEFPVSSIDEVEESQAILHGKGMKVIATSGPYFADDSFDVSLLETFVERLNTDIKPHVVIMFGPFVDCMHPLILNCNFDSLPNEIQEPKTLDELFHRLISPVLKKIDRKIHVILIPSTRDSLSNHAAYPQAPFDKKILQMPSNFRLFTNPTTFQLNEMFFGCSNVDIYKDLKEVTKGGNVFSRNRFDRISEHILQQRRYYPVFPGSIRTQKKTIEGKELHEHITGADLDVPFLGLTEFIGGITPDVMLIPSELIHFARVVRNVIMINPGRFIRPKGASGTYAQISIESPDPVNGKMTLMDSSNKLYLHNLWKRTRVDLVST